MTLDEATNALLEKNELSIGLSTFKIKSLERYKEADNKFYYDCELTRDTSGIIYGHINKTRTKQEAIKSALEQLLKMGYELDE